MRLGIIGSDNSHALGFSRSTNIEQLFGPEVRVVAIFGRDNEEAVAVAREAAISRVVAAPQDMVSHVDAAIVVDRDGALHRAHAAPFITAGIPVLIDKPLATSVSDATAILQLAGKANSLVTSYSSLRWCEDTRELQSQLGGLGCGRLAVVSGPCDLRSPWGGHFFYGIHLVEIALALFPGPVQRVRAIRGRRVTTVVTERDDGPAIILNLLDPDGNGGGASFPFHAAVFGTRGCAARAIQTEPDLYQSLNRFLGMITSGERPLTDEQMLESIRLLEAISRSLDSAGAQITVPRGPGT